MSDQKMEQRVQPVVENPRECSPRRLVVVVGFDGSPSSYRALDAATRLISARRGSIEVVYVAHLPAAAELTVEGMVETLKGFDTLEQQLTDEIRSRLDDVEQRWSLRRRNGAIAHELLDAAEQISRDHGNDVTVVIVVGSAMQPYHHLVGSVPVALVRHAKYPIFVVP